MLKRLHDKVRPTLAQTPSDPIDLAYTNLVVRTVAAAVEDENVQYINTPDGDFWLSLIGLDAEAIKTRLLHRMHRSELSEVA